VVTGLTKLQSIAITLFAFDLHYLYTTHSLLIRRLMTLSIKQQCQQLRQTMRQRRRSLTLTEQAHHANLLAQQLINSFPPQAKCVALYLASDGEVNPLPFIQWCWAHDIDVYLPVLHPFCAGNLLFLRYEPTTKMCVNKYGISEPALDVRLVSPVTNIDIIYTPLVAFDNQGNRMGMGGGYYDRTLAANPHVKTMGLAHDCQQVDALVTQPWDMALNNIITPTQHITAM